MFIITSISISERIISALISSQQLMDSVGKALPALLAAPSLGDPITGFCKSNKDKEPTEMLKRPALQKLNLDIINQRWYNDDKIESVFEPNKFSSPKRRRPNKPPLAIITGKKSPARPLFLLPKKDPTIGLDLVEKCERKSPVCRLFFLPKKDPTIGLDLVEKCDKPKVEFKIPHLLPQKIGFVSHPSSKAQVGKGCRKALFKPSRTSVRTSLCKRRSALSSKSTMIKYLTVINDSLLDSSLVERKIFNAKSRGTFKVKSPCAVQKRSFKSRLKSPAKFQGKKKTPKNAKILPVSTSAKKPSAGEPCTTNSTANYLEEIRNLLLLDKIGFDNFKKKLDAFKQAQENICANLNRKFDALNKERDDRFDKIKSLLQKIEPTPGKCKKDAVNTEPTIVRSEENETPKRTATRVESLRKAALKKSVQFDANVSKALDLYNSIRQNYYGALSTPKINNFRLVVESPTPKDPMKNISRKVQQQCLMLQDTPVKKEINKN